VEVRRLTRTAVPPLGLRSKLVLAALVLLAIPWAGYAYVRAMEQLLRENQERQLAATARTVAVALQDRPRLLAPAADAAEGEPVPPVGDEAGTLLAGLARPGLRIWVIDRRLKLVAAAGNLEAPAPRIVPPVFGPIERAVHVALRPLFERMFRSPPAPREELIPDDVVFGGRELERALDGAPTTRRRPAAGDRGMILSASHPVWSGESVIGAVVLEENTDAIVSLSNRAFEQLAAVTLIAFGAAALVLVAFASRLSWRLRRLRDEAENAIDSGGRVRSLLAGERAGDEIGDLSRSFSTALERLADHNAYLEALAARLAHELRTPIAVVRSSLDNLRLQGTTAGGATYLTRADDGLQRLEKILTRMSEASRLEQLVREGEREPFDARAVLESCAASYAIAYAPRRFRLSLPDGAVLLNGSADLYAQMLDKLAANAVDFATGDDPVELALAREAGAAVLRVANRGPLLPPGIKARLFDSLVSVREGAPADEPHLGLGLYIVRLIAEFHGGQATAMDRPDGSGVVFEIRIPTPQPVPHELTTAQRPRGAGEAAFGRTT
jgi:dedicated sortase system histidine kinase